MQTSLYVYACIYENHSECIMRCFIRSARHTLHLKFNWTFSIKLRTNEKNPIQTQTPSLTFHRVFRWEWEKSLVLQTQILTNSHKRRKRRQNREKKNTNYKSKWDNATVLSFAETIQNSATAEMRMNLISKKWIYEFCCLFDDVKCRSSNVEMTADVSVSFRQACVCKCMCVFVCVRVCLCGGCMRT